MPRPRRYSITFRNHLPLGEPLWGMAHEIPMPVLADLLSAYLESQGCPRLTEQQAYAALTLRENETYVLDHPAAGVIVKCTQSDVSD